MRFRYLAPLLTAAALVASCRSSEAPAPAPSVAPAAGPPTRVVLIVIDTLRRDRLPFYGHSVDTAPYLSRLAREGVVFENAESTSAWTAPATASIFTGMYPFQHGVVTGLAASKRLSRNQPQITVNRIPDEAQTIAETFGGAGYESFAVAENVNLNPALGWDQGFKHYAHLEHEKSAEFVNERALAWKDKLAKAPKSYLYLHYLDPHRPYEERPPIFDPATKGRDRDRSAYDSEIHYVDEHLAKLHEALGWDDAMIVVTGDHGEGFGEHNNVWGHSQTLYAEISDVPLLVRFPKGAGGGRRVAGPVSHVDILATFRDALGLAKDARLPGISLLPATRGEAIPERTIYAHLLRQDEKGNVVKLLRAAWGGNWKWIGGHRAGAFLYDVAADPRETKNLAAERPEIVRALEARYMDFERNSPKLSAQSSKFEMDPAKAETLRSLGYVN